VLGERAGLREPLTLHNFYVPAGGDIPDPAVNVKFAHKLAFLDEMRAHPKLRPAASEHAILVGDLNVAPLEHDVWSHKQMLRVVSHTPIECEKLVGVKQAGGWVDAMRMLVPEPTKLYMVELPRPIGKPPSKNAAGHTPRVAPALSGRVADLNIRKGLRGSASLRVPVTAVLSLIGGADRCCRQKAHLTRIRSCALP
jgi:exodeoxyribonuclease-3